ncbi:EamA family transporter RarD [Georgenia sp. EYE_87]|uniref:EamA family transporter RarD n=1 Tax=Georgenia sp. EYE_87 TaxID=2853448 RepID=UPI0020030CB0|nr:EamA family transporter RarD [Georgenia sp. EYE_87]MCK6210732.1 EamA family transporter RarD [Georgenia sp. EYE_87]
MDATEAKDRRDGLAAALVSYVTWGFFPLYLLLVWDVHALEVVAHRVVWAAALMLVIVAVTRQRTALLRVLADRSSRHLLGLASLLIGVVWFFYAYGALTSRAVDVALGYFVCPLVTVLLAVTVNRERLRPAQWVSAGVGAVAVLVVTLGYGSFPWISVVVAVAFGLYSLVKNRVGRGVSPSVGLTVESMLLVPLAAIVIVAMSMTGTATFAVSGLDATDLFLVLSGPMTMFPLLLFAAAANRLPLSLLGNLQYLNPALQLVSAVLVLQEDMPLARWVGFALVWVSLLVLVVDGARARARARRLEPVG